MKQNTGNLFEMHEKTLWSELLPHEFKTRLADCPIVYLPLGLCEPHGQVSAFGLDTIKAEWICNEAAKWEELWLHPWDTISMRQLSC